MHGRSRSGLKLGCLACSDRSFAPVQVSVKVTADMDLADHLLSFLNVALSSPEAQHALPLCKAFVHALLDLGKKLLASHVPADADAFVVVLRMSSWSLSHLSQ